MTTADRQALAKQIKELALAYRHCNDWPILKYHELAAAVDALAAVQEPTGGVEAWTIIAPDDRRWTGASPVKAAGAAQRDTIDPVLAMKRINAMVDEENAIRDKELAEAYERGKRDATPSRDTQEADARDAKRYRWLREQDWFKGSLCVLRDPKRALTSGAGLGADCPSRERLDAAIDTAMSTATDPAKDARPDAQGAG